MLRRVQVMIPLLVVAFSAGAVFGMFVGLTCCEVDDDEQPLRGPQ